MILDDIVKAKRARLAKSRQSVDDWMRLIEKRHVHARPARFHDMLVEPGLSIIGEIKKASPSKGVLRDAFDPSALAKQYESCVDAISVLTEQDFFFGDQKDLESVRKTVSLPVLQKDFLIDPVQIYQAKAIGADCILLIVRLLDKLTLRAFIKLAHQLHMDALVEVHTAEQVAIACEAGANVIGINNRNLENFTIDMNTTCRLRRLIPSSIPVVSESGFFGAQQINQVKQADVQGVLVGESFMKAHDIQALAREMKRAMRDDGKD